MSAEPVPAWRPHLDLLLRLLGPEFTEHEFMTVWPGSDDVTRHRVVHHERDQYFSVAVSDSGAYIYVDYLGRVNRFGADADGFKTAVLLWKVIKDITPAADAVAAAIAGLEKDLTQRIEAALPDLTFARIGLVFEDGTWRAA